MAISVVVIASLVLSGCGGATPRAQQGVPVMPQPLVSTPTTITAAVDVAWRPVEIAETQAVQLEAAEVQYATCYVDAALNRSLADGTLSTDTPVMETCSTAGLTPAEFQQIQDLIIHAT